MEPLTALEAERRRLAEMLERAAVEPLNLLLAQARAYEQGMAGEPRARMALSVLAALARQALQQVRDLQASLQPALLEALGLGPALEALAGQALRAHGLQVELRLPPTAQRLAPSLERALFRAAQDALDRAVHQAHASRAAVSLDVSHGRLVLEVYDDGAAQPEAEGEDLQPARQEIERLGGRVTTGSGPWGGLRFAVILDLEPSAELTPREMDVARLLAEGLSNKEIGRELSISPRTVNFHLDNLYSKLDVHSRTEAALYAVRHGWERRGPARRDPG